MTTAPGPSACTTPQRMILVRGACAGRETAIEIAGILGTGVTLVPEGDAVVALPDGPTASVTAWPVRMRPVVDVTRWHDGEVRIDVFSRDRPPRAGLRARLMSHALPSTWIAWPSDAAVDGAAADDAGRALVTALSLDADRAALLRDLLSTPTDRPSAEDIARLLDLSDTAMGLLSGDARIRDSTGAVHARRLGTAAAIRESLLAPPDSGSIVARMRRWDHERPALSVVAIVITTALAIGAFLLAFSAAHPLADGWLRGLWLIAASILAFDAIGSLIILIAVRRRRRRG